MNKVQKLIVVVGVATIIFACLNPLREYRHGSYYTRMDQTTLLCVALAGSTAALAYAFKTRKK